MLLGLPVFVGKIEKRGGGEKNVDIDVKRK